MGDDRFEFSFAQVFMLGVLRDSSRRQESVVHDDVVIGADFVDAGQFRETSVPPNLINFTLSKISGVDAVESRWLMKTNVGIGCRPVPSRPRVTIDDGNCGFGVS